MSAIILCYHKVGNEAEEGRKLNVEPARLAQHITFFARRYKILLAKDFAKKWPTKAAAFTFDDAYVSAIEQAAPLLEQSNVRGTFYAVAGMVGGTSTWDGDAARPLADLPALLATQGRGHEIGNHTFTHPRLDLSSEGVQQTEIDRTHDWLVGHGIQPASFCYPYGHFTEVAKQAVSRHYSVGMALGKRTANESDDHLAIPRIAVAFSDALPLLLYRIHVRPFLKRRSR